MNSDADDLLNEDGSLGKAAEAVPGAAELEVDGGTLARREVPRWKVFAWGMWDWATQPFATVITTFVFAVYLTSELFGPENYTSIWMGVAMLITGVFIALLAPVLGQGSDRSGRRMFNLGWQTLLLAALSASLWFVAPAPEYFILGLVLLGVGNVIAEIANVNYYASIEKVATPKSVGRVSGLGWGLGYIGGIAILLLIVGLRGGDFQPDDVRFAMLLCGAWTIVFCIPIFIAVRDDKAKRDLAPPSASGFKAIRDAYARLFRSLRDLYRTAPNTIYFLLASAVFRDGLAGVFTYGAILAGGTFGFSFEEVIVFGIVANLVAGLSTVAFGFLDDKVGPKKVMVISLIALVALGLGVFFLHDYGSIVFWILGLALCLFVGPTQSASRSFLIRVTPEGKAGEIFGLYATTGRAVSFLSSGAWTLSILLSAWWLGSEQTQYFGILGITLVLLVGLCLLIPVKEKGFSFDAKAASK